MALSQSGEFETIVCMAWTGLAVHNSGQRNIIQSDIYVQYILHTSTVLFAYFPPTKIGPVLEKHFHIIMDEWQ